MTNTTSGFRLGGGPSCSVFDCERSYPPPLPPIGRSILSDARYNPVALGDVSRHGV